MKAKIKFVLNSQLIKVSSFTSISTFIKIVATFISAKVLAVFTGPAGVAMLGQLTNFITILIQVSTAATGTGIVKLTGEFKEEKSELKKVIDTSFTINLLFSIVVLIGILLFQNQLTLFVFNDLKYKWLLYFIAIGTPFIAINNFILSVISGLQYFKKYVIINIFASIISVLLTVFLVYFYTIDGALLAYVLTQISIFLVTLFYSKSVQWKETITFQIDKKIVKKLSHFSLYVIVSAFCFPFAQILVRNLIIDKLGIDSAGIWEGTNRISSMYLLLIASAIGVYFFPRISSLKTIQEVNKELSFALKIFCSATIIAGSLLLLLKGFIIPLVLSDKFLPINEILIFQVLGDVFLIAKMLLSMVLLSRAKTTIMIFFEIIFTGIYIISNYYFISNSPELKMIILAYPLYTFLYCLTLFLTYKKIIDASKN
ncbi:MAG: O-antigen translocase [Bacteroidota bacterium]